MKKKWVEYEIYKNCDGEWENWDGIFSTLKEAKAWYNKSYKGDGTEKNTFVIVKATYEVLNSLDSPSPKRKK